MKQLLILLLVLTLGVLASCSSNSNKAPMHENIRGQIITGQRQIVPVYIIDSEKSIYRYGDTVSVFLSSKGDVWYTSNRRIDSASTLAILIR